MCRLVGAVILGQQDQAVVLTVQLGQQNHMFSTTISVQSHKYDITIRQ